MYMSQEQKQKADQWIDQRFMFLQGGEDDDVTLTWLFERFAAARERYDTSICVVDPWNEVSISDRPQDWTAEQWVSQALRQVKRFARKLDVTMVIVAHPAKMRRDRYGNVPKPSLWDIADSAAWANRCDLGVVIYRPDLQSTDDRTEISVEKSRDYYALGKPGVVTLRWSADTSRYVRLGEP